MRTKFLVLILSLFVSGGFACNSGNKTSSNPHDGMNHDAMSHSEMKSAPNAANAPHDLQFIDTMIAHHQGAIEMAKSAETKASRAEIKTLAQSIIAEQEKEIARMKEWRDKWFPGQTAALNMEMAGMTDSMKDMDMKTLGSVSGEAFDLEFIRQMIPHHEGAVLMAKDALQKSQKEDIKTLANEVIKAQEAEIKQMKEWQTAWKR